LDKDGRTSTEEPQGSDVVSSKVLVVDDSAMACQIARQALAGGNYDVVEARNGSVGLQALKEHSFVCILCDVNMPVMNGIEFLEEVRRSGCETPVVMVTTESETYLVRQARQLGAAGWILKPFKASMLLSAVQGIEARHRAEISECAS
jgi:two-component system chemotaxis response regulator CheY